VRAPAILVLLIGCAEEPVPIPPECNGTLELCGLRYDEVSFATTHNAMSNAADMWDHPNQNLGIVRQLDDGIRGLMLDIHEWGDDVLLCHGLCPLGSLPLNDGLARIGHYLHDHRGEVVTIIFESKVPAVRVAEAFRATGLDDLVHTQVPGAPWPTLRELIDADERLIVLTDDDGGGAYPWYMDVWAHATENPYSAATVDELSCAPNRGDPTNPLFIFNHFLTDTFAIPDQADAMNANPFLIDRARTCMTARGHQPNFVTVDFYDQGDVLAAVAELNAR
jgi:hypothetical protein